MDNFVGKILKAIGILTIISGIITGWIMWAIIAKEYNGSIGFGANFVIFGSSFITGMLFIGFAEVIYLLQSINDKEAISKQSEDESINISTSSPTEDYKNSASQLNVKCDINSNITTNENCKATDAQTTEKSKVRIVFDNGIKEEDFRIIISGKDVFNGKAKASQEVVIDCLVGRNKITLANNYIKSTPLDFTVQFNKVTEIHICSTLTSYKVVSTNIISN